MAGIARRASVSGSRVALTLLLAALVFRTAGDVGRLELLPRGLLQIGVLDGGQLLREVLLQHTYMHTHTYMRQGRCEPVNESE